MFSQNVPDSLLQKDYKVLYDKFYVLGDKNPASEIYAQAYLVKAKTDNDSIKTITAYHLLADFFEKDYNKSTKYIDTALSISKKIEHEHSPAALYGKKGYLERYHGYFKRALDSYLKELSFLDAEKDSIRINYANFNIALLKRDLGLYEDAKSILKTALQYDVAFMEKYPKDSINYLVTMSELINTYRLNKQIDSALILNTQINEVAKYSNIDYLYALNRGLLAFYKQKYTETIREIEPVIPQLLAPENDLVFEPYLLIDAYLFLGQSYQATSQQEKALVYYNKLDSLFELSQYIVPDTKTVYLELISYYKVLGDKNKQLLYIEKLLVADSIIDTNYKYLSARFNKDYDLPKLISEKETIIESLQTDKKSTSNRIVLISGLLLLSVLGLSYFYVTQKRFKKRFKVLLEKQRQVVKYKEGRSQITGVPEETLDKILNALAKFEVNHGYLKPNLTSNKLAKSLDTNSKYLSIVINAYKEKGITQYINELRVDYAVYKLKQDQLFRRYTIKAIANDIGFNTAEAFSKAFYKKTGIYPSYFVSQLEKQDVNNS